jgi:hypothetical protein
MTSSWRLSTFFFRCFKYVIASAKIEIVSICTHNLY